MRRSQLSEILKNETEPIQYKKDSILIDKPRCFSCLSDVFFEESLTLPYKQRKRGYYCSFLKKFRMDVIFIIEKTLYII